MIATSYDRAEARINETPELEPYRETCLYDWPEGNEHYDWIAAAPLGQIIDWAQAVNDEETNA